MAASALLSGAFRISNAGNVYNRGLSTTTTISTWFIQDIVLANGVSDFVVSIATLSNAKVVVAIGGGTSNLRINYSGHASYASAASAGWEFKDLWAHIGQASGVLGVHLANSSGDSAAVTLVMGQ